jgi:hypothetical protein
MRAFFFPPSNTIFPILEGDCPYLIRLPLDRLLSSSAAGIVIPMAFRTGGSGVVDRMAIGAGGTAMVETVYVAACIRVIKGGIPIARGMTLGAGYAELSGVGGWLWVAGSAVGWCTFENIIHMTLGTSHSFMRAGQWERNRETKFIVRKINRVNKGQRSIRTAVIRMTAPARTAYSALK